MQKCTTWAPLVARILVGGMFIQAGVMKAMNFAGMVAAAESVGIPMATTAITLAIVIEIIGGLSVLLGWKINWGAGALIVFTLVASYYFHFDFSDQMQVTLLTKNMGIIAALFYMCAFGAGRFALDK